jgi:hypothetical protein
MKGTFMMNPRGRFSEGDLLMLLTLSVAALAATVLTLAAAGILLVVNATSSLHRPTLPRLDDNTR